jgi:hypothetical protein
MRGEMRDIKVALSRGVVGPKAAYQRTVIPGISLAPQD